MALRLLLRCILNTPEAPLPQDRYDRLEVAGTALHYGEFVMDAVRFRVSDY
ncbi:hypothetical protein [Streptomyces sp. UG1]|uniref:hypothetical protein n=1 Tax=Streptomyces sp. UG1 TaxID=3417652 RepID=UPI003CF4430F